MNKNVLTFLACSAGYAEAETVLFGAPFDGTVSYRPGARFAPSAVRGESEGLETYSPYCGEDLTDRLLFDGGDLELPFGNPEKAVAQIERFALKLSDDGKKFLMIGGEHLVTLGAVKAVLRRHTDLHVIHFDAHTDLRDDYLGEKLSHATVMRRIWDLTGDGRIHQFGIRSGERGEFEFAGAHTEIRKFDLNGFGETVEKLRGKPVYITIDADVLDPSVFPGTGTPEPGGVSFSDLLSAVAQFGRLNVVGCDLTELSPHYDSSGCSTAVICKLAREVLLQITKRKRS